MKFYHRTTDEAANTILASGFTDAEGSYGFQDTTLRGVWLSDVPLDCNEGIDGDALLEVELDIPETQLAEEYEAIEEMPGKRYREFLVPAELINKSGRVRLAVEDQEFIAQLPDEAQIAKDTGTH